MDNGRKTGWVKEVGKGSGKCGKGNFLKAVHFDGEKHTIVWMWRMGSFVWQ